MKKKVILFFIFSISLSGFSQTNAFRDLNAFTDQFNFELSENKTLEGTNYGHIEGSAYLDTNFVPGTVTVNDTTQFKGVPLRYNIYSDKIEFMTENNHILEISNSTGSYTFTFENQFFENKQYIYDGEKQQGILQLLVDGTFKLYKKYRIEFETATKAKGFQDPKPDRFEREKDRYFISVKEGTPKLVMRKKDLKNILKPHVAKIDSYIKDEKIKVRSEEDLIQLIEHCNR